MAVALGDEANPTERQSSGLNSAMLTTATTATTSCEHCRATRANFFVRSSKSLYIPHHCHYKPGQPQATSLSAIFRMERKLTMEDVIKYLQQIGYFANASTAAPSSVVAASTLTMSAQSSFFSTAQPGGNYERRGASMQANYATFPQTQLGYAGNVTDPILMVSELVSAET